MSINPPETAPEQSLHHTRRTRDWLIIASVELVTLFLLALILSSQWVAVAVGRWGVIAGLAIFYELRVLKQLLPSMYPSPKGQAVTGLGLHEKLTLASGLFYALLAGFLLVTPPEGRLAWIPAILAALG